MHAKPRLTFGSSCLALALCGLLPVATAGCHKKQEEGDNTAASAPAAPAAQPAPAAAPAAPATTPETTAEAAPPMSSDAGAMSSGTAAAPITGQANDTVAVASATTGSPTIKAGADEATSRKAAAQWSLHQDDIKNDPDGQWAASATASTSYSNHQGNDTFSPMQATGAPNVESYGDNGKAWAPSTQDGGIEWLDLKYAKPVHATEVRVRESQGSGAVVKVELIDDAGVAHRIWSGDDPTKELNYLLLKFPVTSYKVNRVKVTLATNAVPGWNEIDAVQLVGKP
jgi:hypothetical protein